MITTRKLNICKVNSQVRLMMIKMWREKQEFGEEPPPIITPPENLDVMQRRNDGAEAQMGIGG